MTTESEQIFISYAREDGAKAQRLYRDLANLGYRVWLDSEDLKGGVDWKSVIRSEIRRSAIFLALLSNAALDKRGFVQAELREALEVLKEFPLGEVFVVPVRLEDCTPRDARLRDLHWVDLFPSYYPGLERLLRGLPSEVRHPAKLIGQQAPAVNDERLGILREYSELSNRVAQDAVSLLSLAERPGEASRIVAAPIHRRIAEYQPRVQELALQIDLLCSKHMSKAAGPIAAVALILKVSSLNTAVLQRARLDIEKLSPEYIPAFRIAARQELGLISTTE